MWKITPHLWFDKEAREAAELYSSAIPGSRVATVTTIPGTPSGDCDLVAFELGGSPFMAIGAGPVFKFNPSVSLQVRCGTAGEVDAVWERLSPGGKVLMPLDAYPFSPRFGWLEDRYGLSWQIMHTGAVPIRQKVTPFLMFVGSVCGQAEQAAGFYASVFSNAPGGAAAGETRVDVLERYGRNEGPDTEGTVRQARFSLRGQEFGAMDSAAEHRFAFNEAISFLVPCDSQEEIDYFWDRLSADPRAEQCGWLKDRFGLSWQIAPVAMQEWLAGGDQARVARVTQAFLKMKKFDIAALKRAAAG